MERLQKFMADAGVASRRHCEEMIREGLVRVNGQIVTQLPVLIDIDKDRITVEGRRIRPVTKVYYLLNKPKKVVCTNYDPVNKRKRTIDILGGVSERVYPVGRLDQDSQGLVLMTNDGDLANHLIHPRYGVPKTYIAEIPQKIDGADIERLKKGFYVEKGARTTMDRIKIIKRSHTFTALEITLREGRNRQIRRMLARLGYSIKNLTRIKFGPLSSRGLGVGHYRQLKPEEVAELKKIANRAEKQASARDLNAKIKKKPIKTTQHKTPK